MNPLLHLALAALLIAPPQKIVTLAHAVVDAANTNDPSKLAGIYTNDAVVIDEDAPFTWRGASSGVAWWASVERIIRARHATLHAVALPYTEYRRDGNRAYLIQPLKIVKRAGGKTLVEFGMQTYTFRNVNGTWKITSATWTTKP